MKTQNLSWYLLQTRMNFFTEGHNFLTHLQGCTIDNALPSEHWYATWCTTVYYSVTSICGHKTTSFIVAQFHTQPSCTFWPKFFGLRGGPINVSCISYLDGMFLDLICLVIYHACYVLVCILYTFMYGVCTLGRHLCACMLHKPSGTALTLHNKHDIVHLVTHRIIKLHLT